GGPEGLELGDEPAGLAFGVLEAGEVAGAELVVRLCGDHDVPDDDDHGVSHHYDGFLLGGGAAVAAVLHHVPVVQGFEVAVVADRGPGALDQQGLQVRVAGAGLAGAALAGRLVVARAQPGPGGQVRVVGEELLDGDADLGAHRGGGVPADPGAGGQQVPPALEGLHHLLDPGVQPGDRRLQVTDVVQVQAAHQRVVVAEAAFQGHGQVRDLGPHRAPGQVGQH